MNGTVRRTVRHTVLLGTVSAFALCGQAFAGDDPAELEARISALESKLDMILERMDEQDVRLDRSETDALVETSALLKQAAAQAPAPAALSDPAPRLMPAVATVPARPVTSVAAAPAAPVTPANGIRAGDTTLTVGGFVKVDATVTEFDSGSLPTNSLGRDFYIPGTIPVGGDSGDAVFDFNPRETRLVFGLKSDRGGHNIGGKVEMDFQVTNDGNERVSNSYSPRLRQAYVTIDNWLIGQAWSTFQDVAALPENLDFIGPAEGTVFVRQPMIRYKNGPIEIAVEQPETEITTSTGARLLPGEDPLPDLTARYTAKGDWGHFTLAGLVRNLNMEEGLVTGAQSDSVMGYGLSAAGKVKLGTGGDDFRYMLTAGEGIGRYVGVNIVNDAAIDTNGELETIGTLSGFASYRHVWNDKWRSNFTAGYFKADNPVALTGDGVTDEVKSGHVNLIYQVAPKTDIGIEYIYANREIESGADGSMNKLQFSAKYGF